MYLFLALAGTYGSPIFLGTKPGSYSIDVGECVVSCVTRVSTCWDYPHFLTVNLTSSAPVRIYGAKSKEVLEESSCFYPVVPPEEPSTFIARNCHDFMFEEFSQIFPVDKNIGSFIGGISVGKLEEKRGYIEKAKRVCFIAESHFPLRHEIEISVTDNGESKRCSSCITFLAMILGIFFLFLITFFSDRKKVL